MNFSSFKNFYSQILLFWNDLNHFQKLAILGSFGILSALAAILAITATSTSYILLDSPDPMESMDINEINPISMKQKFRIKYSKIK